ncbi:hypothetical protein ABZ172_17355 [Streptomyces sp. NPDC006296]|uniref:hypothetical protein n=1 Tax=Streptomyces sp. NPDC006296 TaxID=3156746 RepID=UPI0033A95D99
MVQKPQSDAEHKERRIDLSLPQVAGSAVAAVAAAVMASQLGVYGTIVGAGVMSVVATCGGSVFQHFFRRTGEQIREVTVQVKHPAGRQVTVRTRETRPAPPMPQDDATRLLGTVGPRTGTDRDRTAALGAAALGAAGRDAAGRADRTTVPGAAGPDTGTDADRTRLLRQLRPGGAAPGAARAGGPGPGGPHADGSYSEARTHGTRVRGWKRSALAATGVFVLSMAGITVYEAVAGHDLGGEGRTTIGSVVGGGGNGGGTTAPSDGNGRQDAPAQEKSGGDGSVPDGGGTTAPGTGGSARPEPSGDGSADSPAPTPSASSGGTTAPETASPTAPAPDATTPAAPDPAGTGAAADRQGGSGTDPAP